jgi:hypothetical protein
VNCSVYQLNLRLFFVLDSENVMRHKELENISRFQKVDDARLGELMTFRRISNFDYSICHEAFRHKRTQGDATGRRDAVQLNGCSRT